MSRRLRASALGLLAGMGLALAGCGQSPVGPGDSALNGGASVVSTPPPIVSFASDGTVGYVWAPVGAPSLASPSPRPVSSSKAIEGCRGGTVTAGRFTVKLPPGAFLGVATVTVSMPDSSVMICDLTITAGPGCNAENRFDVPVDLTADVSAPGLADASEVTMYWYDPDRDLWVDLFVESRHSGSEVTTSLHHFSKYGAGKAGW